MHVYVWVGLLLVVVVMGSDGLVWVGLLLVMESEGDERDRRCQIYCQSKKRKKERNEKQ